MLDLDALQAAAEAATPGPWGLENTGSTDPRDENHPFAVFSEVATRNGHMAEVIGYERQRGGMANASFIAAANPAVILEFVAAHRAVLKQRDDVAKRLSEYLDDSTGGQLSKPWYPVSVMVEDTKAHYAEIAESDHADSCENKDALDAALSRIARLEALHQKVPARYLVTDLNPDRMYDCRACGEGTAWPCATVRALTEGEPSE